MTLFIINLIIILTLLAATFSPFRKSFNNLHFLIKIFDIFLALLFYPFYFIYILFVASKFFYINLKEYLDIEAVKIILK